MSNHKAKCLDLPDRINMEDVEAENPEPEEDSDLASYSCDRHQDVETAPVQTLHTDDLSISRQDEETESSFMMGPQESRDMNSNTLKQDSRIHSENQSCTEQGIVSLSTEDVAERLVAYHNGKELESVPESDRSGVTCQFPCEATSVNGKPGPDVQNQTFNGVTCMDTNSQPTDFDENSPSLKMQPEDEMLEASSWRLKDGDSLKEELNACYLDQDESPPEDELFITENACSDSHREINTEESWKTSASEKIDDDKNMLPSGESLAVTSTEVESCFQTLDSMAQSSEISVEVFGTFNTCGQIGNKDQNAEKDDDLVPECDRKQDLSSLCAACEGSGTRDESQISSHTKLIIEGSSHDHRQNQQSDLDKVYSPEIDVAMNDYAEGESAASPRKIYSISADSRCHGLMQEEQECSVKDHAVKSQAFAGKKCKRLVHKLESETDSEEELMIELDAELQLSMSPRQNELEQPFPAYLPQNGLKQIDVMSSQLCEQFQTQLEHLQNKLFQKEQDIRRLQEEKTRQRQVAQDVLDERNKYKAELLALKDKNPDDLYLPQIKELEYTIAQQQTEVRQLKEKLTSHDSAAKKAIATLQTEMKGRIDQITKLYEDATREKDSMVIRFAEAETKNMESKRAADRLEAKIRELLKEKESLNSKIKAAFTEKQKALAELEIKVGERIAIGKEMEKMKEELSSADYRIKWFQNKLKAELEAHKETKTNLEKTAAKLKEAKEETEQIRQDCQAIIKTYQESEEVRSNSLDKELKMKEMELMIQMKQKTDTEEIQQKTKRELETMKMQYKDALEELKTLKDKVQCLEEERLQGEQLQSKYQTIIQNQKGDNADLQKKVTGFLTLHEDFDRAQEMIRTLDHEIGELKISNRDLQKDLEGCQARESKMLALQSELSRTNALLRSENTIFNNQIVTLSGDVQKMKMEIQDLETRCRDAIENLEEEKKKRKEETTSLAAQLAEKTKECEEYKQKWEDEIDSNKTLKRKHMNNIKDLTRQLHSARKRLEAYETGSGERDNLSMGSRTNSNGSLNSTDNSTHFATNQSNHHHGACTTTSQDLLHLVHQARKLRLGLRRSTL
ncbi:coiled-coil domain-containing protein 186-like isoform X1 [Pomacea canaliculata]|uniref:coiled-coil domain-containing protein 186-like isoform X1 n=1 Tax=Pomacea canaliculata TaxID=400727 RepID=UPI000D726340|nr:coiled-coil domain-containing protein 186-like isoform X1 [Pomacea canaliculata]